MKKNDILLKFQTNNGKLESVLYKKKLSGDVKNLLLSMLYNISNSYNDYANIKVSVEPKNQFIDNIINIIDKCEKIEIVSPSSKEGEKFVKEGKVCDVNTYFKTIKVFPTEKDMLYALFKMNDVNMYLDEKYNLLRVAFPEMLNEGRDINNIEIIRDFNAWSWNTLPQELSNIDCNLIYQNLQILLGYKVLNNWMKSEKQKDSLKKLEKELKRNYDEDNVEKFLEYIYRMSILVCIQRNKLEKTRLTEERKWTEEKLEKLKDKTTLVEELTKIKKKKAKEIKKIDKMLISEELLLKEFEKRNKKLAEYKKIFSVENLVGTLKKERKKALNEIEECNKLLDAKSYVKIKEELEKNLELLKDIKMPKNKEKYKLKIQKVFIECMAERIHKINSTEHKKEAISLLSILRYYNFIVYDEKRFIGEVEELRDDLDKLEGNILEKLYELKVINPITKDIETDIGILRPIFSTRILDLENIVIQTSIKENKIYISIYDGKVLELEFTIENLNNVSMKGKKKVKLFTK